MWLFLKKNEREKTVVFFSRQIKKFKNFLLARKNNNNNNNNNNE